MDRVYKRPQKFLSSPTKQDFLIIPLFAETGFCEVYVVPIAHLHLRRTTGELRPTIVFRCVEFGCNPCVLGSSVYLFDSSSSAVASFNLSKYLNSEDVVLKEDMIRHRAPMTHPKRSVKAVPTPGGKILAFSTQIKFRPIVSWDPNRDPNRGMVDFELYDPDKDCWEDIPPFYQDWDMLNKSSYQSFTICSWTFVDDSTFLIETDEGRFFHLVLGAPGFCSRWEDREWCLGDFSYGGLVVGELCLTPDFILDIKNVSKNQAVVCDFPMTAGFDFAFSFAGHMSRAIIFDKRSSCCYRVEIAQHELGGNHFLQIDVYQLNLVKYFKEKVGTEAKYLKEKKRLDEQYRAEKQNFIDTHSGCSQVDIIKYMMFGTNQKPSRLSCAPQLGYGLLSSTTLCLSPGSSSPRTMTDSITFLSEADVRNTA